MAEDYSVNLKAQLDTTDVQNKLQQLGNTGGNSITKLETAINNLNNSVQQLGKSWHNVAEQQKQAANNMTKLLRGAGAALAGRILESAGAHAQATGHTGDAAIARYGASALKGAGAGAAIGSVIPVVGTGVGAGVGAAAGLLEQAFKDLTDSSKRAADELKALALANEQVEHRILQAELEDRITEMPNQSTASLYARREFLSDALSKYQQQIRNIEGNPKKVAEFINSIDKLTAQHLKEIAAINAELESRGENTDSRADLNEAMAEEARLLKEAAKRESDAWNKAANEANAEVEALKELEAAQKREGEAALAKAKADFDAAQASEQLIESGANGLLGNIEGTMAEEEFQKMLDEGNIGDLMKLRDQYEEMSKSLSSSAYSKAVQARDIGGAEGAGLLSEAQDEWSRAQEAKSRLSQLESVLSVSQPSIQDTMRALGTDAQKGYDTGGYGKLDQQMLKAQQDTANTVKQSQTTLNDIRTKLDEVKNTMQNGTTTSWGNG